MQYLLAVWLMLFGKQQKWHRWCSCRRRNWQTARQTDWQNHSLTTWRSTVLEEMAVPRPVTKFAVIRGVLMSLPCWQTLQLVTAPVKVKVKRKVHPRTSHEGPEGSRCIALLFLQLRRYMGVGSQRLIPAALPPGKTRYPLYRSLGGPRGRSGRVRKISLPLGFDPQTVRP